MESMQTIYTSSGEFYFKQGRSKDFKQKACVTLCIAKFRHKASKAVFSDECMLKSSRNIPLIRRSIHSEELAVAAVQACEASTNS